MKHKLLYFSLLLITIFCFPLLTACENDGEQQNKPSIICSTYAEYDWVQNILGDKKDNFTLTLLTDGGKDLHNYQPAISDIVKISKADMFIYVGGESTSWVDDALKNKQNKDMIVVNLLSILGDKAQIEDDFDEEDEHEHEHEHEEEYDEHVWLSLNNAQTFVTEIAKKIATLDSANADIYKENASNHVDSLTELDNEYQTEIGKCRVKTLVFGDRFPFKYLATDYSLTYFAAFSGCSAETEASFETKINLAKAIKENELAAVVKIETSDGSIAQSIKDTVRNTYNMEIKIIELDSMQKTNSKTSKSYLSIMKSNLTALCEALS